MLEKAGATAVVPEILEPSLQLAAAVLSQVRASATSAGWGDARRGLLRHRCTAQSALPRLIRGPQHTPPNPPQLNMPEDEVAETIRSFRKNHLSELQALAQIRRAAPPLALGWTWAGLGCAELKGSHRPCLAVLTGCSSALSAVLTGCSSALCAPTRLACSGSSLGYGSQKGGDGKPAADDEGSGDESDSVGAGGDAAALPAAA